MRTITTRQDGPLDAICRNVYGDESGYLEAVLAANPGLAADEIVPHGTVIRLPAVEAKKGSETPVVTLWS